MKSIAADSPLVNISLRPFHQDDTDAVAALWRTVFPDAPAHNNPLADIQRKLTVQREREIKIIVLKLVEKPR